VIIEAALRHGIEPPPRLSLWLTPWVPPGSIVFRDRLGLWRIIAVDGDTIGAVGGCA